VLLSVSYLDAESPQVRQAATGDGFLVAARRGVGEKHVQGFAVVACAVVRTPGVVELDRERVFAVEDGLRFGVNLAACAEQLGAQPVANRVIRIRPSFITFEGDGGGVAE